MKLNAKERSRSEDHQRPSPMIMPRRQVTDWRGSLLGLQRTAGNQAALRFLGVRNDARTSRNDTLTVNEPGDVHEREADQVAEQVMRMEASTTATAAVTADSRVQRSLQRKCAQCAEEEEDREKLQRVSADRTMQRKCSHCEEEEEQSGKRLQRTETAAGPVVAPPIVHDVLSSPGRALDSQTRTFFEPRFGQDFSQVRVHTDARAAASALAVNALAYTVGRDVVFGAAQYSPGSDAGRRLLAHELAHVTQQQRDSRPQIQRQSAEQSIRSSITPEYAAGLSDAELNEHILTVAAHARDLDPRSIEYAVLVENLTILSKERETRNAKRRRWGSLPDLMVEWSAAGLLDPPFRPPEVPEIPPLPVTAEEAKRLAAAPVLVGGLAAPRFLPEPIPAPPSPPPLRLVPPVEPVPPPVPAPVRVPVAVPVLVGLTVLLWPSETAPPWMDELNPITGAPYSSKEEYDWIWRRLTPEQRDYLRRLVPLRRMKPDPAADADPDPTIVPLPVPAPKPRKKDEPKTCISAEVPRRGGYARHDAYATKVTGSIYDYYVRTQTNLAINYDGLRAPLLVWEVKVGHGWFFNPDYATLRDLTLARWDAQKSLGLTVASLCGFSHLWTIPDRWIASLLNARWGGTPPVLSIPE